MSHTIYRVEDHEKNGPYITKYLITRQMGKSHANYPTFGADFNLTFDFKYKFAFPSQDKMAAWFSHYLPALIDHGFLVVSLEVNSFSLSKSKRQCVFTEEDVISRTDITKEVYEGYNQKI